MAEWVCAILAANGYNEKQVRGHIYFIRVSGVVEELHSSFYERAASRVEHERVVDARKCILCINRARLLASYIFRINQLLHNRIHRSHTVLCVADAFCAKVMYSSLYTLQTQSICRTEREHIIAPHIRTQNSFTPLPVLTCIACLSCTRIIDSMLDSLVQQHFYADIYRIVLKLLLLLLLV